MKTKILLGIIVLMCISTQYLYATNYCISESELQYAINNPGKPITLSSFSYSVNTLDYIWVTEYSSNLVMVYQDCRFSEPFNQTEKLSTHFNWLGLILLIIGIYLSILSGRHKSVSLAVIPFILLFVIFHSMVYPWLKIAILVIFLISFFCAYLLSKLINTHKKSE